MKKLVYFLAILHPDMIYHDHFVLTGTYEPFEALEDAETVALLSSERIRFRPIGVYSVPKGKKFHAQTEWVRLAAIAYCGDLFIKQEKTDAEL